jgi:antitoxin FitA
MSELLIPDIDPVKLTLLRQKATEHGRSLEEEAKDILEQAAEGAASSIWDEVDALRQRLASSGREFSDSAEILHEDRTR